MIIASSTDAVGSAGTQLALLLTQFLPKLFVSVIVFLVGWIVASIVAAMIDRALGGYDIDKAWRGMGFKQGVSAGRGFSLGRILSEIIKWLIILIALFAALDILGLHQVNNFFQSILAYIPNVVAAAIILVLTGMLANFLDRLIAGSDRAIGGYSPEMIGRVAKWSVLVFGILAAMNQLGIASSFVQMLFGGLVFALSLAAGLAFGLGGKDRAARLLEKNLPDKNR